MKKRLVIAMFGCLLAAGAAQAVVKKTSVIPASAKCPVCGMFVAKYPDWAASIRFSDGTVYWYDGPKDMLSHFLNVARYTPGRQQSAVTSVTVKEYYSLKDMDARHAFFVVGSDVNGPMGSELIPFLSEKSAMAFKADHKGSRIVRFDKIDRQLIKNLN